MLNPLDKLVSFLREKNSLRVGRSEPLKVRGDWDFLLVRGDGSVERRQKQNLIVDGGFDMICNALGAPSGRPAIISHIAVGTGATAAAAGQTALVTPLGARQAATFAHTGGTKVFTMSCSIGPGVCTGAITEAAIFNDLTAGDMLNRVVFSVINKGAGDTLVPTFTFTLS